MRKNRLFINFYTIGMKVRRNSANYITGIEKQTDNLSRVDLAYLKKVYPPMDLLEEIFVRQLKDWVEYDKIKGFTKPEDITEIEFQAHSVQISPDGQTISGFIKAGAKGYKHYISKIKRSGKVKVEHQSHVVKKDELSLYNFYFYMNLPTKDHLGMAAFASIGNRGMITQLRDFIHYYTELNDLPVRFEFKTFLTEPSDKDEIKEVVITKKFLPDVDESVGSDKKRNVKLSKIQIKSIIKGFDSSIFKLPKFLKNTKDPEANIQHIEKELGDLIEIDKDRFEYTYDFRIKTEDDRQRTLRLKENIELELSEDVTDLIDKIDDEYSLESLNSNVQKMIKKLYKRYE